MGLDEAIYDAPATECLSPVDFVKCATFKHPHRRFFLPFPEQYLLFKFPSLDFVEACLW